MRRFNNRRLTCNVPLGKRSKMLAPRQFTISSSEKVKCARRGSSNGSFSTGFCKSQPTVNIDELDDNLAKILRPNVELTSQKEYSEVKENGNSSADVTLFNHPTANSQVSTLDLKAPNSSSSTPHLTQCTPSKTNVPHLVDDTRLDASIANQSSEIPKEPATPITNGPPPNPVATSTPIVNNASPTDDSTNTLRSDSILNNSNSEVHPSSNPTNPTPETSTFTEQPKISDPRLVIYGNHQSKLTGLWIEEQLKGSRDGRFILSKFKNDKCLDREARKSLVDIVISDELEEDPSKSISTERFMDLSAAICQCFPTERETTFYIPFKKDSKGNKIAARGMLFDKYNYMKKKFKKSGLIIGRKRVRVDSEEEVDDGPESPEVLIAIEYLKNNAEPHDEIVKCVVTSNKARLREFRRNNQTADEYITTYAAFAKTTGFIYFDVDFELLYPNKGSILFLKWKRIKFSIIEYAEAKAKRDVDFSKILNSLDIDLTVTDEKSLEITALFLLPLLLPSVALKKGLKPTLVENKNRFLLYAKSAEEAKIKIKLRDDLLRRKELPAQPSAVIIGSIPDCEYNIFFKDITYRCSSALKLIDVCFKIFTILDTGYPVDCALPWLFLRKFIWELESDCDTRYRCIGTLAGDLHLY